MEIEALMHRAQFFLAQGTYEDVTLAMEKNLWTTHPRVEKLLGEAFNKAPVVILIFTIRGTHQFAGMPFSITLLH